MPEASSAPETWGWKMSSFLERIPARCYVRFGEFTFFFVRCSPRLIEVDNILYKALIFLLPFDIRIVKHIEHERTTTKLNKIHLFSFFFGMFF